MATATSLQMHLQHSPRKKNFGYEETIRLLELWTHYTNGGTHPELGKGHRTGRLWLVISERMKAMNYNRGPEECKVRVGNLRAKYTKLKRGYLAGEGVPDWPYYPVLAKFLEGRGDFGDSYDAGSHSYTEPEARPGASHHHPGMFLSMSMEEPNEPLACNVDGGRRGGAGSSRSNDDDSSVSMPESGSSAGSEHGGNDGMNAPPNGHMAGGILPDLPLHPPMLGASQLKRRPVSPADDPRRPPKRPKHGTSTMLLSLMQAMLKIEEEHRLYRITKMIRVVKLFLLLTLICGASAEESLDSAVGVRQYKREFNFSFTIKKTTVKWTGYCQFIGGKEIAKPLLDPNSSLSSMEQCATKCVEDKNCTHFNAYSCTLIQSPNSLAIKTNTYNNCGFIPDRTSQPLVSTSG